MTLYPYDLVLWWEGIHANRLIDFAMYFRDESVSVCVSEKKASNFNPAEKNWNSLKLQADKNASNKILHNNLKHLCTKIISNAVQKSFHHFTFCWSTEKFSLRQFYVRSVNILWLKKMNLFCFHFQTSYTHSCVFIYIT